MHNYSYTKLDKSYNMYNLLQPLCNKLQSNPKILHKFFMDDINMT